MIHPQENDLIIAKLDRSHHRKSFICGIKPLDSYLQKQARQDADRFIAVTYVLLDIQSSSVIGYYTLSATAIEFDMLPDEVTKKLPRYPKIPTTLIGRLAIDQRHHGKGYGKQLPIDALTRSFTTSHAIASFAVLVDAINHEAKTFYMKHGMIPLPQNQQRLYLPMETIKQTIAQDTKSALHV